MKEKAKLLRQNSTDCEMKIWQAIRNNQLGYKFRRQVPFDKYIPDFVCFEKKLIVELDGGQHCNNEKDFKRTKDLEAQGYKVLRFWNNDVLDRFESVLIVIKKTLEDC